MRDDVDRINFYLGDLIHKKPSIDDQYKMSNSPGYSKALTRERNGHPELLSQIRKISPKPFYFWRQEITSPAPPYVLLRSRITTSGVLVNSLYYKRMWTDLHNRPEDIAFHEKKEAVFWRGAASGTGGGWFSKKNKIDRAFRHDLVRKHFNNHNVGFSVLHRPGKKMFDNLGVDGEKYVRSRAKLKEFLQYKYLISVEGNDNDTSLRWKLNSNSLVIMPKPVSQTWLIEDQLKPNVHYVEVSNDWSDLDAKIEWCNSNQNHCLEIINNAQTYMDQFKNIKKEKELELKVLEEYFKLLYSA